MKSSRINILAKLMLFLATIIWGSTFFIMEDTIQNIGVFSLLAVRFLIAAFLLALICAPHLKEIDRGCIIRGLVLGFLVIFAYIFQTFGLADSATTPGKNAFLTAVYCVIVPFLAYLFKGPRPDFYNISAAVLCITGITIISAGGNDFKSVCTGDILTLLGGIFFSFHMVGVSFFSKKYNILLLTMLQFLFAGLIALIFALFSENVPGALPFKSIVAVLYLAIMATCLCYVLQNVGQKYTSPSSSALILSFEAVFGVLFSVIFTSEKLTVRLLIGFAIIFLSVIISELKPKLPPFFKKMTR